MFLSNKLGFMPVWGWIATVGVGGAYLWYRQNTPDGRIKDGQNAPGGQTSSGAGYIDAINASSAIIENQNLGFDTVRFGDAYGPGVSYIDPGFFGDGPLSLWTAGPMEYSDVFGGYGGPGRDRRRDRKRYRGGVFGFGGGGRDLFDSPPGSGGFGWHHSRGPGFPPVPVGGEGYENAGQNVAGFGGERAHGGGMPWGQQTTMGTSGNSYLVQQGDTLTGIANKLWGQGSNFQALASANAGVLSGKGANDALTAGLTLTVPGAPASGPPAPGGPAGNGVGGGSIGANGLNYGIGQHDDYTGASGGGSPSSGQSYSNSSRVKSGNSASNYAVGQGQSGVKTSNKQQPPQRPSRNRPGTGRRGK
jgi:LysM domain